MTCQFVPMYDDLDMAWLYYAQGWLKIVQLWGNHGHWSWLAVK